MAHDEEQEGHSAVKQKPIDTLKNTHYFMGGGALVPGFCRLRDGSGMLQMCGSQFIGLSLWNF
jgi:hypothetical protein